MRLYTHPRYVFNVYSLDDCIVLYVCCVIQKRSSLSTLLQWLLMTGLSSADGDEGLELHCSLGNSGGTILNGIQ